MRLVFVAAAFALLPLSAMSMTVDYDGDGMSDGLRFEGECYEDPTQECVAFVDLSSGPSFPVMSGRSIDFGTTRRFTGQIDADRSGTNIVRIDEVSFGIGRNGAYPVLDAITTRLLSRVSPNIYDLEALRSVHPSPVATEDDLVSFSGSVSGFGSVRVTVAAHPKFGVASPWVITNQAGSVIASGKSMDYPRIYPGDGRVTILDARIGEIVVYRMTRP